jgi:hypothetical protein
MADAGASQRRALHTGITRTGQDSPLEPLGSQGESYFSPDLTQDAPDGNSTRVGLHSGITNRVSKNLLPESPSNQSGSRATGTLGAANAGYDPPIGANGQSYLQHNFGQGDASQGVTDRPSLNSKTPGPDRVLPPQTGSQIHFKMRARDPDCPGVVNRTWVVTGSPDFAAAKYVGVRCGVSPLTEIVVIDLWID